MNFLLLLLLHSQFLQLISGFVVYDCGTKNTNITTISLLNVKPCRIESREPVITETYVRLLQLSRFTNVHVRLCRVTMDREINYCGHWSHNSIVHNGYAEVLVPIAPEECINMHVNHMYRYGGHLFTAIKANSTIHKPVTLAGYVRTDGACEGGKYSDDYGSWDNVIVSAKFKITIQDYYAAVNLDDDHVYLHEGQRCKLSNNQCIDSDGNSAFWNSAPREKCTFPGYDILYEGPARRLYDNTTYSQETEEVYSVSNGDITFGLAKRGSEYVCDYQLIRTEHPKLFIIEIKKDRLQAKLTPIAVNNLDLMTYVNSKFISVEKHFGRQLKDLYVDVLTQKCKLERQVIENSLLIADSKPAEFALRITGEYGNMGKVSGEVIHIVKCLPVPAKLARLDTCYSHLPVIVNNQTMFATPRTRILLKRSPKVNCNGYIAPMYDIDNTWIKLNPVPSQVMPPKELEPMTKPTWKYESITDLASSGIYSQLDLDKLQEHLMFSEEQPAILDSLARGSIGEVMDNPEISFSHLLDEHSIDKIATRATTKLWGWLTSFGTFSAGLIGVFVVIKFVKFILDTLLHGYALHKAYGWSLWILGCLWDSVTNFLLHFKRKGNKEDNPIPEMEKGLGPDEKTPNAPEKQPEENPPANVYPLLPQSAPYHYTPK